MRIGFLFLLSVLAIGSYSSGGDVPFSSEAWTITAEESRIEVHDGVESLWLRNGEALLLGDSLEDGVIEVDVQVSQERGFSGVVWRRTGDDYENFYLRHHLSGLPDATQYQPVFHGVSGWQIYTGPAYGAPASFRPNEWMHLRIEVRGDRARVFLDGGDPLLVIDDLGHESAPGALGVSSGFAPARFANFRFEARSDLEIGAAPATPAPPSGAGLVRRWAVSDAFPEALLSANDELDPEIVSARAWHALEVEPNGIANLARIQPVSPLANTALARIVLEASEPTRQRIDFGFSDRVRVYLDGALVFAGDDGYRSRDYRFLGTVGLHDTVFLDLSPGRNVIDLAVSEDFGGWAVIARLVEREGVRFVAP